MYDPPVKCSCPTVCEQRGTRSFEQEIFEPNCHMQLHEPFRPIDASEVIQYEFFNASVLADFRKSNHISSLQRIDKLDIADMVSQATALLGSSGHGDQGRITRLENGYRKLDLVRGIEYIIDAGISLVENHTTEYRKLLLVRPFGAMHLLSNSVLDDTKLVHFIVAVPGLTSNLRRFLSNFEDVCVHGSDRAYLLIVVCSNNTKEMEAVRSAAKVVQHRHRDTVHIRVVHTRRSFDLALALDLGSRQLPGSALIAFTDIDVRFSRAALRRCQLHTVENHQVYYPVIFSQYDPDIIRHFSPPGIVDNPEMITQHTGEWAAEDYSIACMHAVDYRVVGGYSMSAVNFQYDLYQRHIASGLQVFRAVDLGLVRLFNKVCGKVDSPHGKNEPDACHTKHIGSQYQLSQMLASEQRV